jgi:hypothetical protein
MDGPCALAAREGTWHAKAGLFATDKNVACTFARLSAFIVPQYAENRSR